MDSSVFYSPTGERGQARRQREETARAICRGCPVNESCHLFAMTSHQDFGVWGGRTEAERRSRAKDARPTAREARTTIPRPH
ncbi:WhiB family transcriptional regulator [Streptomyces sp. NPDC005426]|uniref:WhiB family transcriptional regulator n=1 Tax=Streptomyces sp. NPDC005426 TaxID=3155344 RepID=UPI0033B1A70C